MAITSSNGPGKSTTFKALLGTASVTSGDAQLFNRSISTRCYVPWNKTSYVPQRISSGSAISASMIGVIRSGLPGPRHLWTLLGSTTRAVPALERTGVTHRAHSPLNVLSGGQTQHILTARALMHRSELLIVDEPMARIDVTSQTRLAQIVAETKTEGTAIFIVLYELGKPGPLLDRELHISARHVLYGGPPHIEDNHEQHYGGGDHCRSTTEPGPTMRDRGLVSRI